jgi:uncharacterized protein YuzE
MRTKYDSEADALYLRFADAAVVDTEEVRPGVMFDFDANGRIVAIEVLDASEHISASSEWLKIAAAE